MIRNVDIDEISDGKRYHANDMVKIACEDCKGCSSCCHDMDNSIILDPYDIYLIQKGTLKDMNALLEKEIELRVVDGLILPNIKMQEKTEACGFLNEEGRCSIHEFRPGFCRLFPMGRIYENGTFSYFLQVNECSFPNKSKVKLKKWLGIENLSEYEKYVLHYHNLCKSITDGFTVDTSEEVMKSLDMLFLKTLFMNPFDISIPFYEQYYERAKILKTIIPGNAL